MESVWRWRWLVVVIAVLSVRGEAEEPPVTRIAFGSCANQSAPQPIWNAIIEFDPQVFIWLGDNIYGDIRRPFKVFGKERTIGPWKNAPRFVPSPHHEMESRYHLAKSNHAYSRLRHTAKFIGTWDDHDYGLNDAGKEFDSKVTNQRLLLNFLDEPQHSPRRKQQGVYVSYTFGPVTRQIKVILLDTRYHRDPLRSDGNLLGSDQWTWLEKELYAPKTAITIIGSSVQRDGIFFISGDVHFGEISRYDCGTGYPLYDITSSGLTQAVEKAVPSPLRFIVRFVAWLTPTTMRVMSNHCRFKSCTYGQPNFGAIEIDWSTAAVKLKLEVRDINGRPVTGVNFPLLELQWHDVNYTAKKHQRHCSLEVNLPWIFEVNLPWIVRYRLAILFYSAMFVLLFGVIGLGYAALSACRLWLPKCKRD